MQMKLGLSSRIRSLRSAASARGVVTSIKRSASSRNLGFNFFLLLFGFGLLTLSRRRLLIGQQCDQGPYDQHHAADPDPHRQWVVEDLENSFLAVRCCAG